MSAAELFEQFHKNLAVRNEAEISTSYRQITVRLNKDYWGSDDEYLHCLQVGSYGRNTAIHGVSDLDMVFELPLKDLERFKKVEGNGPSQMLQEVKACLLKRYPNTTIMGDGQVVVVEFTGFRVEVLPAFYNSADNSYTYGDSNDGGTWRVCKPRHEIAAFNTLNKRSNANLKRVCKMLRAWKDVHGAPMSGMLIDTLVYNFFSSTTKYDGLSWAAYAELVRDVFSNLANLPKQEYWIAPGSGQRVACGGNFQRKAKKAAAKCQEALDADGDKKKERRWRDVFGGRYFPSSVTESAHERIKFKRTEEFIEDEFPMDIRYDLDIDCEVTHKGGSQLLKKFPWLHVGRALKFFVADCNVPKPYSVMWKVRNVGEAAERRDMIRGQIVKDEGTMAKSERSDFPGPHFVECYVVKDGYCVARDRIEVPIAEGDG